MKKVENQGIYRSAAGGRLAIVPDLETAKAFELDGAVRSLCSATWEFAESDDQHSKAERASVLGFPKGMREHHEKLSRVRNARGVREIKKARASAEKTLKDWDRIEKDARISSHEEFMKDLDQREVTLKEDLLAAELSPDETKHLWDEYANARKIVDAEGRRGLVRHLSSALGELEQLSSDPRNRREHACLATCAKVVLVVVAVVIIAGLVISIYNWVTQ